MNRSYSSGQGRFTSVDPIGMSSASALNPQSNNLYSYVENNPIDFVDPNGLDDIVLPTEVVNISIGDNGPVVSNSGVTGVFGSGDGNQLLMEQIEVTEGGGGGGIDNNPFKATGNCIEQLFDSIANEYRTLA